MTPQLHPEFLERIAAIDWCCKCGQPDNLPISTPHFYVESWQEAEELLQDPLWKEIQILGQICIDGHLHSIYKESYNDDWNRLAIEAQRFIDAVVAPKIRSFAEAKGLPPSFTESVLWDVLDAIMEDTYRDANLPFCISSELLTIYEAGHFPCGWRGEESDGGELAII